MHVEQDGVRAGEHHDGAVQEARLHQRAVLRLHGRVVEGNADEHGLLQLPVDGAAGGGLQALMLRAVVHVAPRRPRAQAVRQQVLRRVHCALARAAWRHILSECFPTWSQAFPFQVSLPSSCANFKSIQLNSCVNKKL